MKDKHDKVTPDFPEVLRTEGRGSYPDMEGDFLYIYSAEGDQRLYDAADKLKAYEEVTFHSTVRAFEELMATHGLNNLLEHMSIQGQAQFWTEIDDLDGGYE